MNKNAKAFVAASEEIFGVGAVLTRDDIARVVAEKNVTYPYWLVTKSEHRSGHGRYTVPQSGDKRMTVTSVPQVQPVSAAVDMAVVSLRQPKLLDESDPAVPEKVEGYVPFGFFNNLVDIIKSRRYFPVFITGLSGNGKTMMAEQVCATLKRECIRVNISIETDESDLIGGPTLINGNVVHKEGPVLTAMRRGAILLLDEIDRGSNKLMCLQGILEGKPYYNKKTGELIHPAEGFNVLATANSKGRGTEANQYLVQILDDAFLERFCITVEQSFPEAKTEKKILNHLIPDAEFVDCLVQWADVVRQTHAQGAIDEVISTRRLVHIAGAFAIFKNRMMAIRLCINRFDAEVKTAFLDLYTKVDASQTPTVAPEPETVKAASSDKEIPF